MSWTAGRWVVLAAGLVLLGGCETSTKLSDLIQLKSDDQASAPLPDQASAEPATTGSAATPSDLPEPATTGSVTVPLPPEDPPDSATATILGSDPSDDVALGKKHYRAGNFGLAERYFRRAVELHPNDAEAWLGLAAAYDRLRRFDLADRAYQNATAIVGPTPEILNNRGFSYMLRGDYRHARETLLAAAARDPKNPYVRNNLQLLDKSYRGGKAVQ